MTEAPRIALVATLDTKGAEVDYVADRIRAFGGQPTVIDSGILGEPTGRPADIPRAAVAEAGGRRLADLQTIGTRGAAVEGMCEGVRAVLLSLWSQGRLDGALCLGGAEGALLGAAGMHALPVGVPKLIVSPSASGRRPFGPSHRRFLNTGIRSEPRRSTRHGLPASRHGSKRSASLYARDSKPAFCSSHQSTA